MSARGVSRAAHPVPVGSPAMKQPADARISCEHLSGNRRRCAHDSDGIQPQSVVVDDDHPEISVLSYAPAASGRHHRPFVSLKPDGPAGLVAPPRQPELHRPRFPPLGP
jgi:hypothetical protein